jgi:RNA polymerase sigma-70 factor (ECF subfamily)
MENNDLKDLVSQVAKNKDRKSFGILFDYFAPRVIGYLVNSGSKIDVAEEITQEVLSNVWQKSAQFNHKKGNVNTWIFTIARNKKIDRIRKKGDSSYNTVELIDALYSNKSNNILEIEEKIEEIQLMLDESEKKLIKMNFFEGKTHKKISEDLEIPLGTVKSKIRNILNKMRKPIK